MRPRSRVVWLVLIVGSSAARAALPQDRPPAPLPLEPVEFPEYEAATLSNGAEVVVVENHEQPVVTVDLRIRSGSAYDPAGREGLATLTAAMLNKGTESRDAMQLAEDIDFLGASFEAGAGEDWTSVTVTTLTEFLDELLGIMADMVRNASFPEDEFEIERTRLLTSLRLELSQPGAVAARAFLGALYGDHPYGNIMTEESLDSIDRVDMMEYHRAHYRPNNALFVVAGDVAADDVVGRLERYFGDWQRGRVLEVSMGATPERAERRILFYHKPGSVQAVVRVGHLMSRATDPDWIPLDVALYVLGGGSTSWLFQVLRQEKGYTYGAYANAAKRVERGYFQANAEVRNEVVDSSLADMLRLIERVRSAPLPEEDLRLAKDYLTASFPRRIETPQQVAGQVATTRLHGLPDDYLETYRDRVAAVDAEEVQRVAREHLRPAEVLIVIVGDAVRIYDKVIPFGSVELFDVQGRPIAVSDLVGRTAPRNPFRRDAVRGRS